MDNYEREIDLRQLIILIAMQWRIIVLAAAVCAFIGSVHQLSANHKRAAAAVTDSGEPQDDIYQYKLTCYNDIKKFYKKEMEDSRRLAATWQAYLDKSPRMTWDPANMVAAEARLEFADHVNVEDVLNSCQDAVKTDAFWTELADRRGVEPKYLRELVRHSRTAPHEITLGAVSGDKQLTEDLLTLLLAAVPEKPRKATRIAPYPVADANIMDWQRGQRRDMLELLNMLAGAYSNYDRLQEPKKPGARRNAASSSGRALVKGGVLGCLVGAFAVCTLMALRLIMGGCVLSPGEFFGKYQHNCLAILPPRPGRRKMLAVDGILLNWSDSPRFAKLTEAQRFEVAAENIRLRVKEGERLLLLGSVDGAELDRVRGALATRLAGNPMAVRQFIDQHLPVMHDIDGHDHIVLVEKLLYSKYRDIDNEVQMIADRGKEIAGCILV